MQRKASSEVDWITSLLFLITITVIFISSINYLSRTENPYESPVQSHLTDISENIETMTSWELTQTPLTLESSYHHENYPLSIIHPLDRSAVNSTFVRDINGQILPGGYDQNESRIYWISDIEEGKNTFVLTYINGSYLNISENIEPSVLQVEGSTISDDTLSLTAGISGITELTFTSIELTSGIIYLATAHSPLIVNESSRTQIIYHEDNITLTIYPESPRIFFHSESPKDIIFHLDNYLTKYHVDGTTYEFNGTNTYTGTADYIDLSNETGIAIIGNSLDLSVDDPGTERTVSIFSVTEFEIYLHEGDHTKIINETTIYSNQNIDIGLKETISGIRPDQVEELEGLYYDEFKETLDIEGIEILVKVEDI